MKSFKEICKMTQPQVKGYMKQYLASKQYKVISEDGFLYAKGDIPVLLVAHMDTVHKELPSRIYNKDGKMSSPEGIGGDDRCGVYMIANIVNTLHCSVLLCEDEEIGCVGAGKFVKTDYAKSLDVNYMIELDRRGNNDAVFYSCANNDFIDFICENTGYKEAWGSFTDISTIMPVSNLCGVNLSCGYYNAHMPSEYVVYAEMLNTIEVVKKLVQIEIAEPFVYVAKQVPIHDFGYGGWGGYGKPSAKKSLAQMARKDTMLELEVVITGIYGEEEVIYVQGNTKAECWFDFFTTYTNVCFDDILSYCFI